MFRFCFCCVRCVFNSFYIFLTVDVFWIHFTFFCCFWCAFDSLLFHACWIHCIFCFCKVSDSFYVLFYFWCMFDSFSVLLFAFNTLLVHFMFSLYLMRCWFVVCAFCSWWDCINSMFSFCLLLMRVLIKFMFFCFWCVVDSYFMYYVFCWVVDSFYVFVCSWCVYASF